MPGNRGGIQRGASSLTHPPDILGAVVYDRTSGGILRKFIQDFQGGDTGGPSLPHYLQYGGRFSGLALVVLYGR